MSEKMKTIGLVGGTSWVSTVDYYRLINQYTNEALKGSNSARIILYSVNFSEIDKAIKKGKLEDAYPVIQNAAKSIKSGGAECILLCANTMHQFAEQIRDELKIPLIHIGEETAKKIKAHHLKKVGLLGTKFTMQMDFYYLKLKEQGIESIVPQNDDFLYVHDAIINEMVKDEFKPETKSRFLKIMTNLANRGAEGIILGCTEIPLLLGDEKFDLPLFNTTEIHAKAAVDFSLGQSY